MRQRSTATGLVAGLTLIFTLVGPAGAAEPSRDRASTSVRAVHEVRTARVRLDRSECPEAGGRSGNGVGRTAPASTGTCTAELTLEVTASPVAPTTKSLAPVGGERLTTSSSCTVTWNITSLRATVQSIFGGFFWSASASATGYGDSCGRVLWTSVTCDQHGIGYAVRIDWCGAYPGRWAWYGYTSSNVGLNITVSAVANGTPIAWTHGARNGFNPYTGTQYGFFAW